VNITIDHSSDLPMYEQIESCIKANILSGKLQFNDALPSVRQLAKELNISTITTKRAYMELEHEGMIYTVSGKGTFVNSIDISKLLSKKRDELIKEYENITLKVMEAGIPEISIINIVKKIYGGQ